MKNKISIDAEKFASEVIHGYTSKNEDFEQIAKDHLTLYLVSYMLIERYNELEGEAFASIDPAEFRKRMEGIQFSPNEYFHK